MRLEESSDVASVKSYDSEPPYKTTDLIWVVYVEKVQIFF